MRAVTGTLTEATSPRCSARATTEHITTVIPTAINPILKTDTAKRATDAPITVPTIWPKPSRIDLCNETRILKEQTMAATTPPSVISKSPTCQETAPAIPATAIWRTHTLRSANR